MSASLAAESTTAPRSTRRVSRNALVHVFLRSLVLQASWNPRGMQNLGFAYAIWPALAQIYTEPAVRQRAVLRHLSTFNCHPYMVAAILGGAIHYEERLARGETSEESVESFKQALLGPLAAVGDSFFWLSLRPFAGALAALLSPWLGLYSVVLFLCVFDLPHFVLRVLFFVGGYRTGDLVVDVVARAGLAKKSVVLRLGCAALALPALALAAQRALASWPDRSSARVSLLLGAVLLAGFASFLVLGRRGPVAAGLVAIIAAMFLVLGFSPGDGLW